MQPIYFASQSKDRRAWGSTIERLINLFPQVQPQSAKGPIALMGTPGSRLHAKLDNTSAQAMRTMGGDLYVVTEIGLYRVADDGGKTLLASKNFGSGVSISDNGAQLCIVNGREGWIVDKDALKDEDGKDEEGKDKDDDDDILEPIQSAGFYGSATVIFQDGYFICHKADSNQFYISDLYDGKTWDPLMFASAETQPDNIVTILSDHRELWLFGEETIEVWVNTGDPDFPFARMGGAFIELGIAAAGTAAKMDNSVFWLANDRIVYQAAGYSPVRISNHAVEYDLTQHDLQDAYAYTYEMEGHNFYCLWIPGADKTWVYDATSGLWHEWGVFKGVVRHDCRHYEYGAHFTCCAIRHNNRIYAGGSESGKVYRLDLDYCYDDGLRIRREAVSAPVFAGKNYLRISALEIDMENGCGTTQPEVDKSACATTLSDTEDPMLSVQWSDDMGWTWSKPRHVSMGRVGEHDKRKIVRRLGRTKGRSFRLFTSAPVPIAINGAYLEAGP